MSNEVVYKSNALIQACYRLSVQEQRIILSAISQVRRDCTPTDEVMYSVSAQTLSELTGSSVKHTYQEIKKAALRLKRREIWIKENPNGEGLKANTMVTGWVQTISYIDSEGRVELRFNKDILPYLTELQSQFTSYRLKNVIQMTSSYGIRFYELLIQWKGKQLLELEIEWLKEAFQIQDSYPRISDFKKWVLEPALKDINNNSDLQVSYTQRKTGRKITHLIFKIKSQKVSKKDKEAKAPVHSPDLPPITKPEPNRSERTKSAKDVALKALEQMKLGLTDA
ncbi:replication initiation protein [Oceanospirillum sediminis]|uniref:Replication initiation protein n=1 Tax=Oceanospirillum sediminis TaxID=2760088 RepID=A0A839IW46_9GAMM|nr:replication initiation protein [Oceanospirillum sediminis]MBB1489585.1 replication initiation protein [Oceanospirillum sediminis]